MIQREVIKDGELGYASPDEVDWEIPSTDQLTGLNINAIPLRGAVQPTRLFYGARFFNQALPAVKGEAPLVQSLSQDDTTSFDEILGRKMGAKFADEDMEVLDVKPGQLKVRTAGGSKTLPYFTAMPFNRYSGLKQIPQVSKGQKVRKGELLWKSNFTDDKGRQAMGLNALVGLVPYKGHSMDDAIVVSEDFAKRATTHHIDTLSHKLGQNGLVGGRGHFVSLFHNAFSRDQLATMDDNGIVAPGTRVMLGDPLVLATRPKTMTSKESQAIGRLSRQARHMRSNASLVWEATDPGVVTHVVNRPDGTVKVVVESERPMRTGDKIAFRSGNKNIGALVVPTAQMPRTADGRPLEVLLNQQGIPSRANPSLVWELLLGKIAAKTGQPVKVKAFNKRDENWADYIAEQLKTHGLTDKEVVFDPNLNRQLAKPITVGNGYVLRLHHISENKADARGQASYDQNEQPLKGGGPGGGAKRRSGLEVMGMLSSGAVKNLRENMVLTGQRNDDFWRAWRSGGQPTAPGVPFVWRKFRALLQGAGMHTEPHADGRLRIGYMTDDHLDKLKPLPLRNGELVDSRTLDPIPGGLFDVGLVGGADGGRYGVIDLPEPMPNPAAEESIRQLLGLTKEQFESVLAGEKSLDDFR
jgi:DNA-directed RNA polymerase subunit beta